MAGVLSPQALCRPASAIKGSALPALAASSRPRAGCTTTSPAATAAAAWCRLGHRQRAAAPSLRVAAAAAEAHTEGAAPGDYVEAHYSIIDDGKVFDSSRSEGGKQAQFILGSGAAARSSAVLACRRHVAWMCVCLRLQHSAAAWVHSVCASHPSRPSACMPPARPLPIPFTACTSSLQPAENLVPGFHQAVGGLKVGESRKWVVRPDDAYGERRCRGLRT